MKILTVLSTFPPHFYGGGEVAAINLSKWLVKQGHEVAVITAADKGERELRGDKIHGLSVWRLHFPRPYVFWNHAKASKWLKPLWYLQDHFDPRNRTLMGSVLDQFNPDCVQIHVVAGIGYNSLREIALRKIPAVYFLHDLNLACFSGGMFKNGQICNRQCTKCRIVSHIRFDDVSSIPNLAFCSPSHANLKKASEVLPLEQYKTAAIFNPNKYPLPTIQRSQQNHIRILYVGRLHKTKGVTLLLEVLKKLAVTHKFTVDILGEGAESESLRSQFAQYSWCHFRGHVSEEEVSNYMAASDVLCVPSIWAEPLGGVVVHALSLGLPVLGSSIGGIPELIDHNQNGLLVTANDSSAWENAIASILDNPLQLTGWGIYAKSNTKKFDQDINGQKIIDLFEEVIQSAKNSLKIAN